MKTTRPRGLADWSPRPETKEILFIALAVLYENKEYWPLTLRQLFYALVGQNQIGKTEADYKRLLDYMNRARRAGLVPFESIRDDGATRRQETAWHGISHFKENIHAWTQSYRLDRQEGQKSRLWVMCEAAGMVPNLARAANPYGVPVLSNGGFDSLTAKHDLAQEILKHDQDCEILHVGDYDPSGEHVFHSLAEDVIAMVTDMGGTRQLVFQRIAVVPEQIAAMNLPSAPPKKTDNRSFSGTEAVQAEAIPPADLIEIVRQEIETRQDVTVRGTLMSREQQESADLQRWAMG